MQVGKNNNNRFRKLIPNNNKQANPTTAQIYSSQPKPYSGSQPKIETLHSNSHKSNFHSLQRQSGEDLKSLRQRQMVERRLRTISAAAFQGQKHTREFNDHNLKRRYEKTNQVQIESDKRDRLVQLMDLIVQFKFKTDSIFKYQEQIVIQQAETKKKQYDDEAIYQEQVYELIRKTRESSINLIAIYLNRVMREIKQDTINYLINYEQEHQINQELKVRHYQDSYLVSDIVCNKGEAKDRRNPKGRGNLMNVNKFFDQN